MSISNTVLLYAASTILLTFLTFSVKILIFLTHCSYFHSHYSHQLARGSANCANKTRYQDLPIVNWRKKIPAATSDINQSVLTGTVGSTGSCAEDYLCEFVYEQ